MLDKKLYPILIASFFFSMSANAQNFGGNPASIKWKQVNTNTSRVIFPNGLDSQANRISNVMALLDSTTLYSIGNKIRKWNVVLLNQGLEANAYVRLAPVMSELFLVPPQDNFANGSVHWDDNLVIHEDRHMQQFSNFNKGLTKVFSFLFGQEGQLLANGISMPDYFFEGDAVWQETLVSKQGRGRMPYFFNGMKSLWLADKKYNWMKLRSGSLRQFVPDHYALGYPLVAYGYEKYGEDFWRKVTEDAVRFKRLFYSFNNAIKKYSGKTYQQFREDALLYFKEQTLSSAAKKEEGFNYITAVKKNNVVDYLFPQFVQDDTIIVSKQSYKEINSFYFLINGKEEKIRVKDYVTDDYFSYKNGKIVYAAYQSDPRWANRSYSVLQVLNVYTREQQQLTFKSKYFSPDINESGTEIIAVNVNTDGSNFLHRLNAATGQLILQVPNPNNYFFTQTKYINNNTAVSAVRNVNGEMALVKVNLSTGETEPLTIFSYNVLGYPSVKNDIVYFSMTDNYQLDKNDKISDRLFAINLKDKKIFRLTENENGIYQPSVNGKGKLLFISFTADGYRLAEANSNALQWKDVASAQQNTATIIGATKAAQQKGASVLYQLADKKNEITKYRKSFQLFNFHSARPYAINPEYGYTFYSDNIVSTFSNSLRYTYNRNEQSHAIAFNAVFAGLFPYLSAGAEYTFNRHIAFRDTNALIRSETFNTAKLRAGFSIPLSFIQGRTFKYLNFGSAYNAEQLFYFDNGKNNLGTKALQYTSSVLSFTNQSRQAKQHINPRWAQTFLLTYSNAYNFSKGYKFIASSSFYLPGIATNHSLVFDMAYQKRDTLSNLFSDNFSFSRGYQSLNQRRMYKFGVNYHLPLFYPDWGFGNIVFCQRIRANAFYDYTSSLTRFSNGVFEIKSRSTGAEIYFDGKIWNSLAASIGVRYSHLIDVDFLNRGAVGRWEIILPINLIPN